MSETSKNLYKLIYRRFISWCTSREIDTPTESDCLAYFIERSNSIKPNSLYAEYSMINASLVVEKGVDLKQFASLSEFMKRQSAGYQSKSYKVFTRKQIMEFVTNAPDEKYLMMKVI